ncbi:hypothetical protein FB570_107341 [Streptomyces sp. T12]|uniref:hypothetical protein n=1 Tax=Streptomyces sp. T12 TaxID=477697 RepID=UPI0011ADC161|nr:hypothetical protein [Streptomyces sp. T12]TWD20535.1 hypothetical protein FB570_107341 [Streptomyces sp. T12]
MTAHDNSEDRGPARADAGHEAPRQDAPEPPGTGHADQRHPAPVPDGTVSDGAEREGPGRGVPGSGGRGDDGARRERSGRDASGTGGTVSDGASRQGLELGTPGPDGTVSDGTEREGPGRGVPGSGGRGDEGTEREGLGRGTPGHGGGRGEGASAGGAPGRGGRRGGGVGSGPPGWDAPSPDGGERYPADALAVALFGEELPEGVREDAAFRAERDAALADLAVLGEQLTLIGDALAGREAAAPAGERPDPEAGTARGGTGTHPAQTAPAALNRPARRRSRYRPVRLVLGGLAAAAAAGLVLGMGWLVSQGGSSADSAVPGFASDAKEDTGSAAAFGPRYLACARLVAEGRVTALEEVPGTGGVQRVTLAAGRYYKGDGPVTFLRDDAADVPLRLGDQVLVGLSPGLAHPDRTVVGEADIAPVRAGIVAALPASRGASCG